jgi:hypothetical protein
MEVWSKKTWQMNNMLHKYLCKTIQVQHFSETQHTTATT